MQPAHGVLHPNLTRRFSRQQLAHPRRAPPVARGTRCAVHIASYRTRGVPLSPPGPGVARRSRAGGAVSPSSDHLGDHPHIDGFDGCGGRAFPPALCVPSASRPACGCPGVNNRRHRRCSGDATQASVRVPRRSFSDHPRALSSLASRVPRRTTPLPGGRQPTAQTDLRAPITGDSAQRQGRSTASNRAKLVADYERGDAVKDFAARNGLPVPVCGEATLAGRPYAVT